MASIFNFVTKEGKHFAPIANSVPKYVVRDGAVTDLDENGDPMTKIVAGAKGVYAKVRLENDSTTKAELFAVNSETFQSSN